MGISINKDDKLMAIAGRRLELWNIDNQKPTGCFLEHGDRVDNVTFSPNGTLLASGGGGIVKLWSVATKECLGVVFETAGQSRSKSSSR